MERYGATWRLAYNNARTRAQDRRVEPGITLPVRDRHKPILTAVEGRVVQFKAREEAHAE